MKIEEKAKKKSEFFGDRFGFLLNVQNVLLSDFSNICSESFDCVFWHNAAS